MNQSVWTRDEARKRNRAKAPEASRSSWADAGVTDISRLSSIGSCLGGPSNTSDVSRLPPSRDTPASVPQRRTLQERRVCGLGPVLRSQRAAIEASLRHLTQDDLERAPKHGNRRYPQLPAESYTPSAHVSPDSRRLRGQNLELHRLRKPMATLDDHRSALTLRDDEKVKNMVQHTDHVLDQSKRWTHALRDPTWLNASGRPFNHGPAEGAD